MEITKEAIELFYRMFFSCYTTGKMSSENNLKRIEANLAKQTSMDFGAFCSELQEWELRGRSIIAVAEGLGKNVIDKEVIFRYFGGPQHTEVILDDLAREQVPVGGNFYRYTIFNHMLVPMRVEMISKKESAIIGVYQNDGVLLRARSILFFEKDRKKIEIGKTVLCHFPMVIDVEPDPMLVQVLLQLQREDMHFMRAAQSFPAGIEHARFPQFSMLRKRMK